MGNLRLEGPACRSGIPLPAQVTTTCPSTSASLFPLRSGAPVRTAVLPQSLAWLRLFSQFFSLFPSNNTTTSVPCGARTPWRPCVPMATAVTSLWARLTTPVRSLAVARGTGGCKESGRRGWWRGKRCGLSKAPAGVRSRRPRASSRGGKRARPPFARPLPLFLVTPSRPRNGLAREGGGARRHRPRPGSAP